MTGNDGAHRFDHVVSLMFENRSFDNLLGHLYEPGEVASFEGVAGSDLSNPIPSYAPGAERGAVPLHVATSMDTPNPDAGEEHPHMNTQLFGTWHPRTTGSVLRGDAAAVQRPGRPGQRADDGRLRHRLRQHLPQRDGPPARATTSTPRSCPATRLSRCRSSRPSPGGSRPSTTGSARSHRRRSPTVPSSTRPARPVSWSTPPLRQLPAPQRRRDDLRAARRRRAAPGACTVDPGMPFSITGMIHTPRLSNQFAHPLLHPLTTSSPTPRRASCPPTRSSSRTCCTRTTTTTRLQRARSRPVGGPTLVDPGRRGAARPRLLRDPRLLHRGWFELRQHPVPGLLRRARRHLRPRPAAAQPLRRDPAAPAGQMGFRFDRSGVRIPTLAVSAYIDPRRS